MELVCPTPSFGDSSTLLPFVRECKVARAAGFSIRP